jgi:hypothetical protein
MALSKIKHCRGGDASSINAGAAAATRGEVCDFY